MLTETEEIEYLELLEQERRDESRKHHLDFIDYTWTSIDPFVVGFHTKKICAEIDEAIENFRKGISSYLLISVHPRSGKSVIVSRYLGPHFLGEFPDKEVLQVSYQANLAATFSTFGRNVVKSPKYKQLYPKVQLSQETNKKDDWVLVNGEGRPTGGRLYASGLQSGLTGNGFHLGILDDYCAGRSEAESAVFRNHSWDSFTNDFMTRRAPVCICIVLATQWHVDDINGRIKNEMVKNPDFPQFKVLSFPAKACDYKGEGKYPAEYLFEERYDKKWYRSQYATLGKYSAAALMDCDPMARSGGRLSTDGIVYSDEMPDDREVQWARIWDLAHTAKQREGDDPDWTSGTRMAFKYQGSDHVPYLYVADVARTREGAVKRDSLMKAKALADGYYVKQGIENTIDSKDAFEYVSKAIPEVSWNKLEIRGDKGSRATPLEAIFQTPGHVIVKRADWNDDWLNEIIRFDGTGRDHDDQVDNLSAGYEFLVNKARLYSDKVRAEMAAIRG